MRVLIDADMIAHEVGHLREKPVDENGERLLDEDGDFVRGELLPLKQVIQVAKGRFLSIVMGSEGGTWKGFLTRGRG